MNNPAIALLLLSALSLSQVDLRAEERGVDVNLSQNIQESHAKDKGTFDGQLPQGWHQDFCWNASDASSKLMTEEGRSFLRIHVSKLDQSAQFYYDLKELEIPGSYKVTVACRLHSVGLDVGIRQIPPPYGTLWSGEITPDSEGWIERSFTLSLEEKSAVPVGLFIYPGMGDVDVASIKIARLSAEELAQSVKRPPKDTANFFRNSRFSLGMQAGWSLSREFTGGSVEADPSVIGPSGFPSLKLESDKPLTIFSEPFQTADPLAKNFVSLSVKGTGDWTLTLVESCRNGRANEFRREKLSLSKEWKTQTVEFKLEGKSQGAKAFALKISGTGMLHIDSLQAWAGEPGRGYTSQGECEVALAYPKSEFSDERIQFCDEPPRFDYCVTGSIDGATLKLKAVNPYGQEEALADVTLGRSLLGRLVGAGKPTMENGSVSFDAFRVAPLGHFRIEAWVERGGARVSPVNELLLTRIKRPVHLNADAPESPFGSHFMASPLTIRMMKAVGVNWARFHDASTDLIGWYHLETEKGKWTFHDDAIKLYRDNHISIFAGLQTAPTWASAYKDCGKKDFNGYFDRYFQPTDMGAWENYVKTVTARYKGVIDEYFIWNEPWGDSFWHTGYDAAKNVYTQSPTAAADFAKLSIATYKAAKEGNQASKISGFDTCGSKWTEGVFDAGAYPFCDMVDFHFYTPKDQAQPGDQAQSSYDSSIGYIKKKVPDFAKPVYMSEGQGNSNGSVGGSGVGLYKNAVCWDTDAKQALVNADKTCRFVVANLAAGSSKVFLYSAHCYTCLAVDASFVTIIGSDGYPSVETAAYANLTSQLEGLTFLKKVKLTDKVNAYLFQGKNSSTAVISGARSGVFAIPQSERYAVSDLFGNPVIGTATYKGYLLYVTSTLSAEQLEHALLAVK